MRSLYASKRLGTDVATTNMTYTPRGDVAWVTEADGITLSFEYDKAGRLIVDGGASTTYRYDADGSVGSHGECDGCGFGGS